MAETHASQQDNDTFQPPHGREAPGGEQRSRGPRDFGAGREETFGGSGESSPFGAFETQGGVAKEIAKAWVRQNQTPAMLGSFAIGVTLGLLMRR